MIRVPAQQHFVRRPFIVEAEAVAVVPDLANAVISPSHGMRGAHALPPAMPVGVVGRMGRVQREGVQDIGEQQFLVLLLVM